jgi:hypothetical protein
MLSDEESYGSIEAIFLSRTEHLGKVRREYSWRRCRKRRRASSDD